MTREFLSFVLVGGFAAGVNVGSRALLSPFMSFELAVVVAYLFGMVTAFLLNRAFVFETASAGQAGRQGFRFALVNLVALAQVWVVGEVLVRLVFPSLHFAWHAETVGHTVAVASPIVTSYVAHKHFSFAPDRPDVAERVGAMPAP